MVWSRKRGRFIFKVNSFYRGIHFILGVVACLICPPVPLRVN